MRIGFARHVLIYSASKPFNGCAARLHHASCAGSCGRLCQLARAFENNSNSAVSSIPSIRPGTRLVREWGDQVHLVNVEASGYEYQGARYKSLSEIARVITGTHWSGPLWPPGRLSRSRLLGSLLLTIAEIPLERRAIQKLLAFSGPRINSRSSRLSLRLPLRRPAARGLALGSMLWLHSVLRAHVPVPFPCR